MSLDTLSTTLVSKHPLTPAVAQFIVEADGHTFDHQPGQHVSIAYRDADDDLVVRPYSPVSRPGTSRLALAIKRYDGGTCSVWMHGRSVGDAVPLLDPSGNLHLRDLDRDVAFLSTGTGITPMVAMLKQYLAEGSGRARFVFGERTQEALMYRETLDHLAADHARLSVDYVLSREDWGGRTGYVQHHLDDVLAGLEAPHVFVCGVPAMVVDTKAALQDHGVPEDRVFSEGWEDGAVDDA